MDDKLLDHYETLTTKQERVNYLLSVGVIAEYQSTFDNYRARCGDIYLSITAYDEQILVKKATDFLKSQLN